jgi:predicted amino acid-binding ACT domain protein
MTDQGLISALAKRANDAGDTLATTLDQMNESFSSGLSDAVRIVDDQAGTAAEFVEGLSQESVNLLQTTLTIAQDYIQENDIKISVSGNTIRIEGDQEGLQNVMADLEEVLKGRDVRVEYDREDGIDIQFDN